MFCPSCGTNIPEDYAFCMKCGRSMAIAPKAAAPEKDDSRRTRARLDTLGRRLLVCLAVACLVSMFFYLKDRSLTAGTDKNIDGPSDGQQSSTVTSSTPSASTPSPEPTPVKLSPGEIAAKYADAVVVLDNYNDQGQRASQGSGFITSRDGTVLTNYHVIRGASRMIARAHGEIHEVE
jgi:hypothetical protein